MSNTVKTKFKINYTHQNQYKVKSVKLSGSALALLSLSACGGNGVNPTISPAPAPRSGTFSEISSNVFLAVDDMDSTINNSESLAYLTVVGLGGDDTITTGSGRDTIIGGSGADTINSGAGNDIVDGGSGGDIMDGGSGTIDILDYRESAGGVEINLTTLSASGGDATGDTFVNFEGVVGSVGDDELIGDDNDNYLWGNKGSDSISAGGGSDFIYSGYGSDTVDGGAGNDHFYSYQYDGSATSDQFDGGEGYDEFKFISNSAVTAYNVDLADVDAVNIEFIHMGHVNKESLTLTAQDVIDVTDADNILNVIGHAPDAVSSDSTWTYVNDVMSVGEIYHQYTSGAATINIYFEVGSQTGFAKPATTFTETSTNIFDAIDNSSSSISLEHKGADLSISGKDGDDLIATGSGDDIINGGAGNDSMRGNSGSDVLNGDAGDDILIYDGENHTYNGGADDDTLLLVGQENEIDLSALTLTNMEVVDLSSIYENSLTLTASDVIDVTDVDDFLTIDGDANDSISLSGGGWTQGADDGAYHTYTSGAATLYVDQDITQNII